MEPRDRAAEAVTRRFRLLAGCAVLTALALIQQPGRIVGDTKIDLVVDPGGFLARALSMWDVEGQLGQVQNQAYGYLFPMGPFFWLGDLLRAEPWVVQRLWWALVWCVAFVGVVRLCRALGIGTPRLQLLAGFVFALSPRFLSVLGPSSIETWPAALAPWVLVPLVVGIRSGRPWLQAARSALAVGCVGGVNAVATAAVLPLGLLWLLMAPQGPRRRALLLWWPPLVVVATLWWLVPLLLLGGYSPPFLDHIESAATTSSTATLLDALRGTTAWVPRVSWQTVAGGGLLTQPMLVVNVLVLVALGVAGLARRDLPHRRFLVTGLLAGLVLMTLGHTGDVAGWFAHDLQAGLDGALAPLRNAHKFDVVTRLPLVLGLTHLVSVWLAGDREDRAVRTRRSGVALVVAAATIGATSPAWGGDVAPRGTFGEVPDYWVQATDWMAEQPSGTTLVLPASAFADHIWGSTGDELVQPLARSAWVTRTVVPLTPPGTVRLLDSLTDAASTGRPASGLVTSLRRAGIDRVVVRFDLADLADPERAELVWRTLRATQDLAEEARFGPPLGGAPFTEANGDRVFLAGGWQSSHPAIVVFAVDGPEAPGPADVNAVPVVAGGADTLAELDRLGLLGSGSVLLAADRPDGARGPWTLTDGLRRQEVDFSAVDRNRSATLGTGEPYRFDRGTHDYLSDGAGPWTATVRLEGARSLTASSSRSDAGAPGGTRPGSGPWAAFDGDPRSSWQATSGTGWIRLVLDRPTDLGTLTIRTGQPPGALQELTVTTEDGPRTVEVVGDGPVEVAVGTVDRVEVSGRREVVGRLQIAEISSPALDLARPLVVPAQDGQGVGPLARVVLGLDAGRRPGCLLVDGAVRCRADVAERGEDAFLVDRIVSLPRSDEFDVRVDTAPLGGSALDAVLQQGLSWQVRGSSFVADDPLTSATRMIDGDPRTGWIADPEDLEAAVDLSWDTPQTLTALGLTTDASLPASGVDRVRIETESGEVRTAPVVRGRAVLATPLTAQRVRVFLTSREDAVDNTRDGALVDLPVGISELTVEGPGGAEPPTDRAVLDRATLALPCGSGPRLTIDDLVVETSAFTTRADLAAGVDPTVVPCIDGGLELGAGEHRVRSTAAELFEAGTIVLTSRSAAVGPATGQQLVATDHNANAGWTATVEGEPADSVQLDGWRQGYVVPAGQLPVESYAPGTAYRLALGAGGVALLALLATVVVGSVRERRRPVGAAVGDERPSRWSSGIVVLGGGTLALGLLAGTLGALAVPVAAATLGVLPRRVGVLARSVLPIGLVGAVALVLVLDGDLGRVAAGGATVQWLVVGVLAVVVGGAVLPDRRTATRRMAGRSTQR